MGVIKQGILGGFQNKVGPVIGSSWKGIATMRAMPISVANPRTAPQVTQRNKFSAASKIASKILAGTIKPLWDRFAQAQSGYNAWVQANIQYFLSGESVQAASLVMSKGTVALPGNIQMDYTPLSGEFNASWDTALIGDALATDQVYITVVAFDAEFAFSRPNVAVRSAGSVTLSFAGTGLPSSFAAYLTMRRADGSRVSDSFVVSSWV